MFTNSSFGKLGLIWSRDVYSFTFNIKTTLLYKKEEGVFTTYCLIDMSRITLSLFRANCVKLKLLKNTCRKSHASLRSFHKT